MIHALAHISDLHIGRDSATDAAARRLCAGLIAWGVDDVLLTGDVTHRGRADELRRFHAIFEPLLDDGRLCVVPGNHDRMGDDAGRTLMPGPRVQVEWRPGLHVVRVDSTGPHNRSLLNGHGALSSGDVDDALAALREAAPATLSVVLLHHHVLPLPEDDLAERITTLLGWPCARELPLGRRLLEGARGRCDLVLHGHRHAAGEVAVAGRRHLRILNAGSTTSMARLRLVYHSAGASAGERWIDVASAPPRAAARLPARLAAELAAPGEAALA